MTQHICGTCRYFEEGGFAASGRCNHPERHEIRMMVLVRKNELACREHWDGGLWEPRESVEPALVSKSPSPASTLVAETPVSDHFQQQYTDRVTSVGVAPMTRPVSEPVVARDVTVSRELSSNDPVQPVERVTPISERPAENSTQESVSSVELRRESWGNAQPEINRIEPSERPRVDAPRINRPSEPSSAPPTRPVARTDDTFARSWGAPRAFDEDQIRPVTPRAADLEKRSGNVAPPPSGRTNPARSSNIDDLSQLLSRPRSNGTPASPVQPTQSDPDIERFGSRMPTGSGSPAHRVDDTLVGGRRGWTEPFETTDKAQPAARAADPPASTRSEPEPVSHARETRQQPEPPKAAPNPKMASIAQCCGTCRDFRPADGGERGWCNNQYAFDHRRMVRRNDLACRSTIGDWWIPSDDWWLQQADYSHHGRPTPIVDDLLRQLLDSRANGTNSRNNGRG